MTIMMLILVETPGIGERRAGTAGGLYFAGGGEDALYAFDKVTGEELWHGALTERSTATPMTYETDDGQQFVLIATGSGANQELVAFSLP